MLRQGGAKNRQDCKVLGPAGLLLELDQGRKVDDVHGEAALQVHLRGSCHEVFIGESLANGSQAVEVAVLGIQELVAGAHQV